MRKLLVMCVLGLAIVAGISLYALSVVSDVKHKDAKLTQTYEERAADLLATNERVPYQPRGQLDAARFAAWLEIRAELTREYGQRLSEKEGRGVFHARHTHNELLRILLERLDKHRMSFREYQDTAARWRALLARAEFPKLQRAWRDTVYNITYPRGRGLPLPEPARDADASELELLHANTARLKATMYADLLGPLLDEIAG